MDKLVSIIIPTYNRAHLIGATLDSVLHQTYRNWECLVIDDGSDDYTRELIKFYGERDHRIKYHQRPHTRHSGGNAARNFGFEICQGDYIQWFDSDNIMLPEKIELKVLKLMHGNTDFVVCENAEIINEEKLQVKKKWPIIKSGDVLFNHLSEEIAFDTNGPMFRRDFLENKDLFDEQLKIGQDWEFFSRLLVSKPNIIYIHQVLYYLRTLKDGIRETKSIDKTVSKIESELRLFNLIRRSNYFQDSELRKDYNRLVFYRILSRYEFIREHISFSSGIKYIFKAYLEIDRSYFLKGFRRSISKPANFLNIFKILKK